MPGLPLGPTNSRPVAFPDGYYCGGFSFEIIRGAMTDRELATALIHFSKKCLVDSMAKSSSLAELLQKKPKLSDGRVLTDDILKSVHDRALVQAHQEVDGVFQALEFAVSEGNDTTLALRKLLDTVE